LASGEVCKTYFRTKINYVRNLFFRKIDEPTKRCLIWLKKSHTPYKHRISNDSGLKEKQMIRNAPRNGV